MLWSGSAWFPMWSTFICDAFSLALHLHHNSQLHEILVFYKLLPNRSHKMIIQHDAPRISSIRIPIINSCLRYYFDKLDILFWFHFDKKKISFLKNVSKISTNFTNMHLPWRWSLVSTTLSASPQLPSTHKHSICSMLYQVPRAFFLPALIHSKTRRGIKLPPWTLVYCNVTCTSFVDFVYVGGTWNNVELLGNCNWNLLAPPGTRMEAHAGPRRILSDDMVA